MIAVSAASVHVVGPAAVLPRSPEYEATHRYVPGCGTTNAAERYEPLPFTVVVAVNAGGPVQVWSSGPNSSKVIAPPGARPAVRCAVS